MGVTLKALWSILPIEKASSEENYYLQKKQNTFLNLRQLVRPQETKHFKIDII